jgi:hypothetical protein
MHVGTQMLAEESNDTSNEEDIKMATTSDGISRKDWDVVHELAVDIVNASAKEDDAMVRIYKQRLFKYLDDLETKYGLLPSILDTRADFTDDSRISLNLHSQAYMLGTAYHDIRSQRSQLYIAFSIAELYVEDFQDVKEGQKWLNIVKKHLKQGSDDFDVWQYKRLMAELKRLKSQKEKVKSTLDS